MSARASNESSETKGSSNNPAASSIAGTSAAENAITKAMCKKAALLREELKECHKAGDYSKFGELIKNEDGAPLALLLKKSPEQVENFRCLLTLNKEETREGAAVLVRNTAGYDGAHLLLSVGEMAPATIGVDTIGTVISVSKPPPPSPREGIRHRMPDLMNTAIEHFGGSHLACLSGFLPNTTVVIHGVAPRRR